MSETAGRTTAPGQAAVFPHGGEVVRDWRASKNLVEWHRGASLVLCGESAIQKKSGDRSIWSNTINSGKKAY
jgi:hypothetical protein